MSEHVSEVRPIDGFVPPLTDAQIIYFAHEARKRGGSSVGLVVKRAAA